MSEKMSKKISKQMSENNVKVISNSLQSTVNSTQLPSTPGNSRQLPSTSTNSRQLPSFHFNSRQLPSYPFQPLQLHPIPPNYFQSSIKLQSTLPNSTGSFKVPSKSLQLYPTPFKSLQLP
jgi:hypothetical protein